MAFLICEVDDDVKDILESIISDNPQHHRNAIIQNLLLGGIDAACGLDQEDERVVSTSTSNKLENATEFEIVHDPSVVSWGDYEDDFDQSISRR